jgi:hypothetical protein
MDTYSKSRTRRTIVWLVAILLVPLMHVVCADESPDWAKAITSGKGPGDFIDPPPMRLTYRFGWSGIQAATCDVHLYSPARDRFEVEATGATSGLARMLFRLDVYHRATESKDTLTPIHFYQEGETESLVVWASNAPYLATVKVVGRETVKFNGENKKAIKLDLKLKGIDKKLRLKDHSLFKAGRGWLSDDDKRIPLRIEADIFIGYVFAQLESMNFD